MMRTFKINTEYIQLIQLLKAARIAESGGQAKLFVDEGEVLRDGKPEMRKRAKLYPGDEITIFGESIRIIAEK